MSHKGAVSSNLMGGVAKVARLCVTKTFEPVMLVVPLAVENQLRH
jgi:hypothetical protein